ncbi:hypothetical protein ACFL5K_03470 [Gemmatimonadota bacterium]
MKKKKKNSVRRPFSAQKRLDRILSNLDGETDYTFDHKRGDEHLLRPQVLSVAGNRELFNTLCRRDYHYLTNLPIRAEERILPLLLPQSVLGRAQNGHGMFCDERGKPLLFKDATIENVISGIGTEGLGIRCMEIRKGRQRLLDNLETFLIGCLDQQKITFGPAYDENKNPLGVSFLEGLTLDTEAFLKGFELGVMMDNWRNRQRTAKHFKVTLSGHPLILGGGESLLVNYNRFIECGMTEQQVSDEVNTPDTLQKLRELEVVVSENESSFSPGPVSLYFRRMVGSGISDDAAIVYIGKTYGTDAMYGCFVADAADTYDKYVEDYVEGGTDEKLLRTLHQRMQSIGKSKVSQKEVSRLIYFSAKDNDPQIDVSSSHRRLIQIEPGSKKPTLLNHLAYIKGEKPYRIPMGYNRYDSDKFYTRIAERADILRLNWKDGSKSEF